jgi:hypothetical protein
MGVEEIVLIAGLGFAAYYMWTNSAIGQLTDTIVGGAEEAIKDAVGIFETIEGGIVDFANKAASEIQTSVDVGIGEIPNCRSDWTCGHCDGGKKNNIDGLCYNDCPRGLTRRPAMPYSCYKPAL